MAVPLLLAAAVPSLVGAGVSLYKSIKDGEEAKKIDPKRPKYNIPGEVLQNQDMYKTLANTNRIAGQSIAENNIDQTSAQTLRAGQNSLGGANEIAGLLSNVNRNENAQKNNLFMQGAQMRMGNMGRLASANDTVAGYKDKQFGYNEDEPYREKAARKNALLKSAEGNANEAVNSLGQAGGNALNAYAYSQMFSTPNPDKEKP